MSEMTFVNISILISLVWGVITLLIHTYFSERGKFESAMLDKSVAIEIERKGRLK